MLRKRGTRRVETWLNRSPQVDTNGLNNVGTRLAAPPRIEVQGYANEVLVC
jgi:hypothetical protein